MDDFELELKEEFIEEASQLLDDAEQAFLNLESEPENPELLDKIFRLAHNLKGTSRAVGFGDVAEFTHEMENLILKLKNNEMVASANVVTVLLVCNDHLISMIETLKGDLNASIDSSEVISQILACMNSDAGHVEEVSADVEESETEDIVASTDSESEFDDAAFEEVDSSMFQEEINMDKIAELEASIMEHTEMSKIQDPVTDEVPDNVTPIAPAPTSKKSPPAPQGSSKQQDQSIRVALSRVELLNNYVGELVILQAVLSQHKEDIESKIVLKTLGHLAKLSKEIQDISMRLRMLPLKGVFTKMQRIVRDSSKALSKEVNLHIDGDETEVDKTVLEQLGDPLVHIIRNAVDHGIESNVQDRLDAGKTAQGNVYLDAFHEGNKLVIEIGDDGAGICPDKIRSKAVEKGVLRPGQQISDLDAINLIFHPGFSTKDQVSEISGRGVGMDVVKTNINSIGGTVIVESVKGKGSIFRITLPLTLAIIDGMVMKVGEERFVIPLTQIHETLQLTSDNCKSVNGMGECLDLRGEVIPTFDLAKVLNMKREEEPTYRIAIVVCEKDKKFAIAVDDIIHQQQVVIKKIGEEIKNRQGFMGSSILGDGKPAFILDLNELVEKRIKQRTSVRTGLAA